jgi:acyl-CoA synthetase (AMP-forming)/AMP-acid ligase II
MTSPPVRQVSLAQYEQEYHGRRLIHWAVDYWAGRKPEESAGSNAARGARLTWRDLQSGSGALANDLWRRGFRAGDDLAASLPLLDQQILLKFACFRPDVVRCLSLLRARGGTNDG